MTYDIVFLSVPRIAPVRPAAGLPVLKTLATQAGKTSRILDLNQDFYMNFTKQNAQVAKEIDEYYVLRDSKLSDETKAQYEAWMDSWIDCVLALKPELVGISIFSWQSQKFVLDFLSRFRSRYSGKIIVGGQGLENSQNMSSHWSSRAGFAQHLLSEGLIDWFLKGECEETFLKFLNNDTDVPGLNSHEVVTLADVNQMPISDFSDFDLNKYQNGYPGGVLPVESCRGCVRSCIFCEMSTKHGAYRRKDGVQLANEIIHYYETYGVQHYYFHDDLINGDLKDFNNFVDTILEYYQTQGLPDRYFSFSGYWIIRPKRQFGEDDFLKFYRAGGLTLVTGVETGSDRLRKFMRKGFTNKDLEFNLSMISKLRMKFYFMLIAGLPGETAEDFQETLNALERWQVYVASGAIIGINLGTTATIEPGTKIYEQAEKFNIVGLKGKKPQGIHWMSTETPDLNYKERVRRRVLLQEHTLNLGYPLWKGDDHLKIIVDRYKENIEIWEA